MNIFDFLGSVVPALPIPLNLTAFYKEQYHSLCVGFITWTQIKTVPFSCSSVFGDDAFIGTTDQPVYGLINCPEKLRKYCVDSYELILEGCYDSAPQEFKDDVDEEDREWKEDMIKRSAFPIQRVFTKEIEQHFRYKIEDQQLFLRNRDEKEWKKVKSYDG